MGNQEKALMKNKAPIAHEKYPDAYHGIYSRTVFGFWVYLLTDCVLFGTLFAAFAVLRNQTFGNPSAADLFSLRFTLIQTLVLLVSSLTIGLGAASAHRRLKKATIAWFLATFVLGLVFFWTECFELSRLASMGADWTKSAFLSAYFTLVGTHGLHVFFGILWIPLLLVPVYLRGVEPVSIRRLTCLKMFWQFLNIIWVFLFTFAYLLMGVSRYD